MSDSDPKRVIAERLTAPSVVIAEHPATGGGGWRGRQTRGGMGADLATLRFLKERGIPGRQVHAVTFTDAEGQRMRSTCYLTRDDVGEWRFSGGAGGGADGDPVRDHPWVNLGGGGWPANFYAGGTVLGAGLDIARVRLIAANGTVLEDSVDDGVVLFVTDQPVELPLRAELYDRTGALGGSHQVWPFMPPS